MNNIQKGIIQITSVAVTIFLTVVLVIWTIIPYSQMWSFFSNVKSGLNTGDVEPLIHSSHIFSPMTYIQPIMRYYFLDFITNIYASGDSATEKERNFADKTVVFAIDKMSESLKDQPHYASFFLRLGVAYDFMGNFNPDRAKEFQLKAEEQFKKSLEIYPKNQKTLFAYAINLANQHKVDEAISVINEMVAYEKGLKETNFYLGALLYMKDNSANSNIALEKLEKALDDGINPMGNLTKTIYQKMFTKYYADRDINRFKIVVRRLILLDFNQALSYKKIYEYIKEKNSLPIINLK